MHPLLQNNKYDENTYYKSIFIPRSIQIILDRNIKVLDISNSSIKQLPEKSCLPFLEKLYCNNLQINMVPDYKRLSYLECCNNPIKNINCSALKYADVRNCPLDTLHYISGLIKRSTLILQKYSTLQLKFKNTLIHNSKGVMIDWINYTCKVKNIIIMIDRIIYGKYLMSAPNQKIIRTNIFNFKLIT
jgi:Leucine-rich repeat (LRR) protein